MDSFKKSIDGKIGRQTDKHTNRQTEGQKDREREGETFHHLWSNQKRLDRPTIFLDVSFR